jgi:hypothetical protein
MVAYLYKSLKACGVDLCELENFSLPLLRRKGDVERHQLQSLQPFGVQ